MEVLSVKVMYIAAECKPFSKVGGVGDVAGELPPELKRQGVHVEIVTPLYGVVQPEFVGSKQFEFNVTFQKSMEKATVFNGELNGVPVHFIKNSTYFEGKYRKPYINSPEIPYYDDILRFSFFSKACLTWIDRIQPDIVHINDWPLCYLFGGMAMQGMPQRRVLTYHNIAYQGNIGRVSIRKLDVQRILRDGKFGRFFVDPRRTWRSVNAMRLGLELAHRVNTVSPNYCKETLQAEDPSRFFVGGKGLHRITKRLAEQGKLIGILNGFEYTTEPSDEKFDEMLKCKAEMKKKIGKHFSNPNAFLLGFVGRAVEQKFRLLTEVIDGKSVMEHILDIPNVNVAVLACGLPEYESFIRNVPHIGNYSFHIAFDREKAKQICLGSDVFLLPSLFEPCGIAQMESMSNATPPLVRWTGGLVDTVEHFRRKQGTGFGFNGSSRHEILNNLIATVREASAYFYNNRSGFRNLQKRGFQKRFSWSKTAGTYIEKIYLPALVSDGSV